MKPVSDWAPRFIVTSVTGWTICRDGQRGSRESTIYQVLDRPWNYALVREFSGRNAKSRAEWFADWLESKPERDDRRHGTTRMYNAHRCRCERCCAAKAEHRRRRREANAA